MKTKQQGTTAEQKPRAPPNKSGLPAVSASSLITLQLNPHRFRHSRWTLDGKDKRLAQKLNVGLEREESRAGQSFRVSRDGETLHCEWPRARLNQDGAAFTCSVDAQTFGC